MKVLNTLGYIFIPLLFIDIFYFLYTYFCKFYMRKKGIDESELNKVRKIWIIIAYIVYTIIAILSVFIFPNYYSSGFIENLKNEMLVVLLLCLLTYAGRSIVMNLKHYFGFTKDMYKEFKNSKKDFDNIDEKFKNKDSKDKK